MMQSAPITDPQIWADLLQRFEHDFYHLPAYVSLCADHDKGQGLLFMARDGDSLFCQPLIINRINTDEEWEYYDAVSPYGYSGPLVNVARGQDKERFMAQALAALYAFCRENKIISVFVRFHPILSERSGVYNRCGRLVLHGETVSIDLTLSDEEIWRQIRRNHRDGIKKLTTGSLTVGIDPGFVHLKQFGQIYRRNMERNQADPFYHFSDDYFEQLHQVLGSRLHLCVIKDGERLVCAGLFTDFNGLVQAHLIGTSDDYIKGNPAKLLFDYMRRWSKDRGFRLLHLGGGVGGVADSLFHFKAGFSKVRHLFYTWRAITDPEIYSRMVRKWETSQGVPADGKDGYFPAYRKGTVKGSQAAPDNPDAEGIICTARL